MSHARVASVQDLIIMVLRLGDIGPEVKRLQRGLNKLGAMLLIDGQFGSGTRRAVEDARAALNQPGPPVADDGLQAAVAALADPFPPLTAAGVTFIARAEVSDAASYRRKFHRPCWPGRKSGITIGIGYDCRFVDAAQLRADWGDVLGAEILRRLLEAAGRVGSDDLLAQLGDVSVPLGAAMTVFTRRTLPEFEAKTRQIYPQLDQLLPARRTALVSLVYNRGARLTDLDPARQDRREMRAIRDRLDAGALDLVADQFESMTRLWDPAAERGLILRRRAEATLWRSGFEALLLN